MQTTIYNSRLQSIHLTSEYAILRNCPQLTDVTWSNDLHSLDLEGSGVQTLSPLPSSLRYLNISKTRITTMPDIPTVTFLLADEITFVDASTPRRLPWESGYQYADRVRSWQRMRKTA